MEKNDDLQQLFIRWFNNQATEQEMRQLAEQFDLSVLTQQAEPLLKAEWNKLPESNTYSMEKINELASRILEKEPAQDPAPVHYIPFLRKWSWVAASVLIVLAAGAYLWIPAADTHLVKTVKNTPPIQVPPGKDGAVLTLADGSAVALDELANGEVAQQNGAKVLLRNGRLYYDLTGENVSGMVYNTMATPKGRQFKVLLPDGTGVWLNAASSIRYPTVFNSRERRVEITGEVYFEVAKDAAKPFLVQVNKAAEIEVLGTHFNVNAYTNEPVLKTTLLEGSIKLKPSLSKAQWSMLKAGQQAQVNKTISIINNVNTEEIMAWKNGIFNFENAGLQEVMRQLERWYNIEVVYERQVPDIHFGGAMSRSIPLADVLTGLEGAGVHFRMEGDKKLIVMP